ncbi:lytic transglycosylase domain-containing protein [uncultured Alsobacter sp.]|uniref:lytic transglycosylase domain-containing protein n=1 Tax=uncultured Alsobacter sp. TaxID=1748258 RepID=UPI0025D5CB90|nr:lytic transglycosylase domain-containing protein [uncultured Alsobacter sp.]
MFLFTTPASPQTDKTAGQAGPSAGNPVVDAIRTGSERTGADFGYLLSTARRESSLDPDAKATSSSATGLFQFIEQTWLGVVKGTGQNHGLTPYSQAITEKGGRFDVTDPSMKAQILALRNDPKVAAIMAGELTRKNAAMLSSSLGRQPSEGELYAAHFMGASGAADLIRAASTQPTTRAADLFPDQAASNKAIFYDKGTGQARSVSEVHALLVSGQGKLAVPSVPQLSGDPSTWLGSRPTEQPLAAAYVEGGPAMHGLFRTEGPRGPVNQAVEKLWSRPASASASTQDAPRFFPRSEGTLKPTASPTVAPVSGNGRSVVPTPQVLAPKPADVPLPPARTAAVQVQTPAQVPLLGQVKAAAQAPAAAPAAKQTQPAAARRGQPLDLLAFMKPGIRS